MSDREPLLGMTAPAMEELATRLGQPRFRRKQLYHWIYRKGASTFDSMHTLPQRFRDSLREIATIGTNAPVRVSGSEDGTRKYLFPTRHGKFVETAWIPDGKRETLCISTQIGCRRSCTFCQTARQGFQGNLSAGEILNQYHSVPDRSSITNIVYMGMGEPLDNIDATLDSVAILSDPDAYGLAPRRITLSTVGIHPHLETFLEASAANLAVSLHNPFPEERRRLAPVENAHPIEETIRLIRARREDKRRRVSFEYTMFLGFNDTPRHIDGIAKLLNGLSVRINLIPFHRIGGTPLRPTAPTEIERFAVGLRAKGIPTSVRRSRGQDIDAACGMLRIRISPAPPIGSRITNASTRSPEPKRDA